LRWSADLTRTSILKTIKIDSKTLEKIIDIFIKRIEIDSEENKVMLGGHGVTINVDEAMLNFKIKSRSGRSTTNCTDALAIIESRGYITCVFACVIPYKKSQTLIPIVTNNVLIGNLIHYDELRS
jgi:hypothetical protein